MTSTNRDVAHDINCGIGFNIACIFYFGTADGKESVIEVENHCQTEIARYMFRYGYTALYSFIKGNCVTDDEL